MFSNLVIFALKTAIRYDYVVKYPNIKNKLLYDIPDLLAHHAQKG